MSRQYCIITPWINSLFWDWFGLIFVCVTPSADHMSKLRSNSASIIFIQRPVAPPLITLMLHHSSTALPAWPHNSAKWHQQNTFLCITLHHFHSHTPISSFHCHSLFHLFHLTRCWAFFFSLVISALVVTNSVKTTATSISHHWDNVTVS